MTDTRWGATPEEWELFSKTLGLTEALLPVVSNPHATISPDSTVDILGKLPSKYNTKGEVVGVTWRKIKVDQTNINAWKEQPDFGMGINCQWLRCADLDLHDKELVADVLRIFEEVCNGYQFPIRYREDSARVLIPYKLEGHYPKRVLSFPGKKGDIEFLGDGQFFVACGTHQSGKRYEWWFAGKPEIPTLTPEQFETIYNRILTEFPNVTEKRAKETRKEKLDKVKSECKILAKLYELDMVVDTEADGRVHIICPFADSHTSQSATSTTYFPPNTGGFADARIKCLHSHCAHRHTEDYLAEIGITMFDDLSEKEALFSEKLEEKPISAAFTKFGQVARDAKPLKWIIRDVIPATAELGMIWGATGCGKSFMVIDLAYSIARGEPWRGFEVCEQGKVVYIAAEGRGGLPMRIKAYEAEHEIDEEQPPVYLLEGRPNLLRPAEVEELIKQVNELGGVRVIFVDTMSSSMAGGNENSAEDMTKMFSYCRSLAYQTGAVVVLVHHAGKDAEKGPRGSSLFTQWVDFDIKVLRDAVHTDRRSVVINKQRDAQDKQEYGFTLKQVPIGVDDDGIPLDSCVIEHTDVLPDKVRGRLGAGKKSVLKGLKKLFKKREEYPSRDFLTNYLIEETGKRKADIYRSIDGLIADGILEELQGIISPLED